MSDSVSPYRAKVQQREVDEAPPTHAMPEKFTAQEWQPDAKGGRLSLFTLTLLLGLLALFAFSIVDAIWYLQSAYAESPVLSIVLAVVLSAFCGCLLWLVTREIRGYRAVNKYLHRTPDLAELAQSSHEEALKALKKHAATFSEESFAAHRFRQYQHSVQDHMSAKETVRLYERVVDEPVAARAREVVRRESMVSGSLAFVSPNHLIQTLAILWISLRMVRRVAQVYGLRPATTGNWRLMTILAQNLAAQSIFDLASDEIANQISGSLTARFVENSAEAVAAGALNVRLGKALIKLLS
ncbi:DUF697 domain-containing protein [Salinimonas sp. HHU 13199]|uniref:DUF697 domain-containing protein n=1 Tax=Salinimonas profundi TaxID=2729140 RepID=A0ABR8LSR1_9ALTE|nr:YcjF family protein [Salinimonas profundi]MBD3587472.1 DUF697 domain-containing protein [Salinimonas profundi]